VIDGDVEDLGARYGGRQTALAFRTDLGVKCRDQNHGRNSDIGEPGLGIKLAHSRKCLGQVADRGAPQFLVDPIVVAQI